MAGEFDAAALAALATKELEPHLCVWLDILTDPLRGTSAPYDLTFAGTGDADLDGYTFNSRGHALVDVTPVKHGETGSGTLSLSLSGLLGVNTDLMNLLGNAANWQGRTVRLWRVLVDEDGDPIGTPKNRYTGSMMAVRFSGDTRQQTVTIECESYLANLAEPSGRTYLDQADYDPNDASAAQSISIANGTTGQGGGAVPGASGSFRVGRDLATAIA